MDVTGLVRLLDRDPVVEQACAQLRTRGELTIVAPAGVRPALLATLAASSPAGAGPLVVVTATGRDADELAAALQCYRGDAGQRVAVLPSWETLPHERLSPRSDTVARRLAVFRRLVRPGSTPATGPIDVLVLPVRALLQPIADGLADLEPVELAVGDESDPVDLARRLSDAAYARVDMVGRRGEFAVRGGIVDVFPPTDDHPMRVEFWGNRVEEIRWFSVADQRSLEVADNGLWAPPCRELLLTPAIMDRAAALAEELPGAADMLAKLAEGIAVEGMESLMPVLVERMIPVLDLVPDDATIVMADPERIRRRAHDLVATTQEFLHAAWISAAAGAQVPVDLSAASFATLAEVRGVVAQRGLGWWSISPFGGDGEPEVPEPPVGHGRNAAQGPSDRGDVAPGEQTAGVTTLRMAASDPQRYRGDIDAAVAQVKALQHQQWTVVLATQGHGPAQRLVERLRAFDVPATLAPDIAEAPEPGVVHVVVAPIPGMRVDSVHLLVITEADLTGRTGTSTKDMRKMPSRRRDAVDPLQLRPGDLVVHDQHGVGRFIEMMQRTLGSGATAATREYLVIEYAASKRGQPGDRLFVPSDQLDQVTRYVGGEAPSLNKLGGGDWAKTKAKARSAVREIAGELIRLYSARMATPGYAFGPDTPWQAELEDAFPYVETPDQLATIDEVKADMEKAVPMDRLVCGDVGYGKTEIAVRAAFKAVQDGKQVAVLVPTTLLVQQHLDTFAERYAPFPVTVKALSRFQTAKESKAIVDGLADGTVDVVIGTHRLITGEVRFKDLGLVIIDEEQRFGVEHKETLKALRTNVDVLAMSATPIPRTLEMAVTGIREMSTLTTPPEERHPVLTFVGPYEEAQIGAAIRRELLREGQVFYVHNRVDSIEKAASRLAEIVPEARIGVAHGKMNEHQLEQVIVDFWERRFDVLVTTTIVETGLDISNANTLILERADLLGLSQLHQLRGRVGRGRERAYAYFLYPPEKPLTETAHDRLTTIAAHTELGAGMAVAMKDLEIRGAGNMLGGEQSGHIEGVGFDLYIRMVGEAVAAFRDDVPAQLPDVTIELPVDAHLPHEYVEHERLRLEAYGKIANAADDDAIAAVAAELVDRYGPIPEPVTALLDVARFRNHARALGLAEITAQGRYVRLSPVQLAESAQLRLKRLYPGVVLKPAIRSVLVPYPTTARIGGRPLRGAEVLAWATQLLDTVIAAPVAR